MPWLPVYPANAVVVVVTVVIMVVEVRLGFLTAWKQDSRYSSEVLKPEKTFLV